MKKFSTLLCTLLLLVAGYAAKAQDANGVYAHPDENPVPLRTVAPVAPNGQTGLVAVLCIVDESGKVIDATVKKSTNPVLEQPAVAAVQAWTFKPARKDGKPVKVKVTVPVRFEDRA